MPLSLSDSLVLLHLHLEKTVVCVLTFSIVAYTRAQVEAKLDEQISAAIIVANE